jgi:hypothetical protein
MKRLGIVLLVITLQGMIGCSDMGNDVHPNALLLTGSWIWVRSTGGFWGEVINPSPGEVIKDVYTIQGSFSRFKNDTLILSAHYCLSDGKYGTFMELSEIRKYPGYPVSDPSYPFGYFDGLGQEWLSFEGGSLLLADNGMDTYFHTFVRLTE